MRGDSVRDLYAKTLALMGLGVLAGAGALVDYWPTGVVLPIVDSAFASAAPVAPLAVPSRTVAPRNAVADLPQVRLAVMPRASTSLISLRVPPGPVAPIRVAWTRPATPSLTVVSASELTGTSLELTAPVVAAAEPPYFAPGVAPEAVSDSQGFISGAVRRTGNTIARTGARTGASVVDALRAVGGAVRKALPN